MRDFLVRQSLDEGEPHHAPLRLAEAIHRSRDGMAECRVIDPLLRTGHRLRIGRRHAVFGLGHADFAISRPATQPVQAGVARDRADPAFRRATAGIEALGTAPDLFERFRADFFGLIRAAKHRQRYAVNPIDLSVEQHRECVPVGTTNRFDQLW